MTVSQLRLPVGTQLVHAAAALGIVDGCAQMSTRSRRAVKQASAINGRTTAQVASYNDKTGYKLDTQNDVFTLLGWEDELPKIENEWSGALCADGQGSAGGCARCGVVLRSSES